MSTTDASKTRYNTGPLTTGFLQPWSCSVGFDTSDGMALRSRPAYYGMTCHEMWGAMTREACWPQTTQGAETPYAGWGFYSPGIVCPTQQVPACTAIGGQPTSWQAKYSPEVGETAVGCCPTGFTCSDNNRCKSRVTTGTIETQTCVTESGTRQGSSPTLTHIVPDPSIGLESVEVIADLIQINFRSSDLPGGSFPGGSLPGGSYTTTSPTSTITGVNSPAVTDPPSDGGGPSDAIAARVVKGLVVSGLISASVSVLISGCILWRRRRLQRRTPDVDVSLEGPMGELENKHGAPGVHELPGSQDEAGVYEAGSNGLHEAADNQVYEAGGHHAYEAGSNPVAELPANGEYHSHRDSER